MHKKLPFRQLYILGLFAFVCASLLLALSRPQKQISYRYLGSLTEASSMTGVYMRTGPDLQLSYLVMVRKCPDSKLTENMQVDLTIRSDSHILQSRITMAILKKVNWITQTSDLQDFAVVDPVTDAKKLASFLNDNAVVNIDMKHEAGVEGVWDVYLYTVWQRSAWSILLTRIEK